MHDVGVTLRDGSLATVRPIRPDDGEFLRAVFERLSDESRYRRFLSRGSQLSDPVVRDLTHVDHHDHEALVAAAGDGTVVGVARYVRLPRDPEAAEAAVAIVCQSVVAVILRRDGTPLPAALRRSHPALPLSTAPALDRRGVRRPPAVASIPPELAASGSYRGPLGFGGAQHCAQGARCRSRNSRDSRVARVRAPREAGCTRRPLG